jgi:DNA-binding FrmR family transcriptional regulator
MYDAEVPRLHQQVKDLTSKLDDLVTQVKASDKAVEEAKEQAKHEQLQNLVTDEDRQEFGDDLIAISRKIAREESAELYKQLEAVQGENNQLREMLEQTGSKVTQTSFEQELHRLVPDFVQVNADPNWIQWLDEHDPLLRAPRRVVAEKSFSEGDADSVAHFVNLFKNSQQEADPAQQVVNKEIESQIQPSKSTSSPSTPAPKGKTYTNDQIRAMFVKITHMQKAGKSDEARKLEAEIDAAYMEGRVAA